MVSPWDSHRRLPGGWKPDDDAAPPEFDMPQPPGVDGELSWPPISDVPAQPDWLEAPSVGSLDGERAKKSGKIRHRRRRQKITSLGKPQVPLALGALSLLVALVVFVGLRVVSVSVTSGSNSTTAVDNGESTQTSLATETTLPDSSDVTATSLTPAADIPVGAGAEVDWNEIARSVVYFEVTGGCQWVGSGTLILDGSYVLTNWHVSGGGECPIRVGLTASASIPPNEFYPASVVAWDSQLDLAIVQLQTSTGTPFIPPNRRPVAFSSQEAKLGDPVRLLGYPVVRDDQFEVGERYTLTLTDGAVSGTEDFGNRPGYNPTDSRRYTYEVWGEYIKHTAIQNGGVSGGGAFNARGELVAVPTAGGDKLELMRSIRFAKELIAIVSQ